MRIAISNNELRALLDWFMCSDPWPGGDQQVIETLLNSLSGEYGYKDWITAYHNLNIEGCG